MSKGKFTPNGEKDFWKFYIEHKENFDTIIEAQIRRRAALMSGLDSMDMDDIRQDVLVDLERSNILEKYSEEKAAFNTYLTSTVRGYVCHWFDRQRTSRWNPYPSEKLDYKNDYKKLPHTLQVYSKTLNVTCTQDEADPLDESITEPDFEDELSLKQTLELLRKKLTKSNAVVFDLLVEGFNSAEIAEKLKISPAMVSFKVSHIKKIGLSVSKK